MVFRKLLLFALFTLISLAGIKAQDDITVHGTVADEAGVPQEGITVIVSVIFVDSSGTYVTLLTDVDGSYEVGLDSPGPNMFGWLTVSMVDCQGVTINQYFSVGNGITDVQADFVYCEDINVDSCAVVILQEWTPGTNNVILTAWTPGGFDLAYLWSTGETTPSITPLTSGTYCVTVSSPFGCEASDCVTIDLDSSGNCFVYIISSDNNDGSYNLQAIASGNAPFEYLWNTGVSASYMNNVGPGTYCVTIYDGAGCSYSSCIFIEDWDFCEVYIYEDPANGGLSAYGYGQEPIVYVWSTGDTSQNIIPNEPGFYCVTATDANGCEAYSYVRECSN